MEDRSTTGRKTRRRASEKKTPAASDAPRDWMREILSESEVRFLSRRLRKVTGGISGELSSDSVRDIEDTVRFQSVATRLIEAREARGMDLKAAAKSLRVPQYRLKDIEQSSVKNLRPSDLRAYIGFCSLGEWFAQWREANNKLAARLDPAHKAKHK